jgi:hypothetical protein
MSKRNDSTGGRTRRPRVIGNPVARSPLLRKGGVHERSASGKRQRAKLSTYDALEEWLETRDDESSDEMEKGSFGSPFFWACGFLAGEPDVTQWNPGSLTRIFHPVAWKCE